MLKKNKEALNIKNINPTLAKNLSQHGSSVLINIMSYLSNVSLCSIYVVFEFSVIVTQQYCKLVPVCHLYYGPDDGKVNFRNRSAKQNVIENVHLRVDIFH